jgi:hypothetical protein
MATTIIDFSPQALEIDQVAEAAGTINPNVPPPTLPTVNISTDPNSDRGFGNVYVANAPDILFVAEYASPGANAIGALIVFENYYNSSHYELWKRVYTSQDATWQRIFIIDSTHLKDETARFRDYIENRLGFTIPAGYYAVLDTDVQADQIVEYKIAAGNYPTSAAVDYEVVLFSQGGLNSVPVNAGETVFGFSQRVFGTSDYAWIASLMNLNVPFFGKRAATQPMLSFLQGATTAYVPRDLGIIPKLVQESIYFFGVRATVKNLLKYTKDPTEIATKFYDLVLASILENDTTLSYGTLLAKLWETYPKYERYTYDINNGVVKNQPITLPVFPPVTRFNNLLDLTTMFLCLNSALIGAVYALDGDPVLKTFQENLGTLLQNIGRNVGKK